MVDNLKDVSPTPSNYELFILIIIIINNNNG